MNTEIILKENELVAPVLKINFEEVNKALDVMLNDYRNIAVTEDTLKAAKEDKRKITSLRTSIEAFRKEKKKMLEAPIKELDSGCKELTAKVVEVEKVLQSEIDEFDNKVRAEKKEKAEAAIADAITRYSLNDKYSVKLVVKDKYMNLTGSYKSVKEDIEKEAVALKAIQDAEDKLLAEAKGVISTGNENLTKQFDIVEFKDRIDYFISQNDGDGFISLIKEKMAEQKALEDEIKKKAIEIEKAKLEKEAIEAAKKAAEEEIKQDEVKVEETKETASENTEEVSLPTGASKPEEPLKPSITPVQEVLYKMNFDVVGSFKDLAKFGEEMSELCKKYNCEYLVDRSRSGRVRTEGAA